MVETQSKSIAICKSASIQRWTSPSKFAGPWHPNFEIWTNLDRGARRRSELHRIEPHLTILRGPNEGERTLTHLPSGEKYIRFCNQNAFFNTYLFFSYECENQLRRRSKSFILNTLTNDFIPWIWKTRERESLAFFVHPSLRLLVRELQGVLRVRPRHI